MSLALNLLCVVSLIIVHVYFSLWYGLIQSYTEKMHIHFTSPSNYLSVRSTSVNAPTYSHLPLPAHTRLPPPLSSFSSLFPNSTFTDFSFILYLSVARQLMRRPTLIYFTSNIFFHGASSEVSLQ